MYSNNIVDFQESTTIINACTKKSGNLLNAPRMFVSFPEPKKLHQSKKKKKKKEKKKEKKHLKSVKGVVLLLELFLKL